MILGTISFKISDEYSAQILKYIMSNNIETKDTYKSKGYLYITVSYELKNDIIRFFERINAEYAIVYKKGFLYRINLLLKKKGMIIGIIFCGIIIYYISNIIFSFEILCDNEQTVNTIKTVLKDNGVKAGSYIPSIDFTVIERKLVQNVDDISWAGISVNGNKIIIDTIKNIEKSEFRRERLPSNLIATHDAVIDKIEISDGQIIKTVGSGIAKGDIIVSGTIIKRKDYYRRGIEHHDVYIRYARSIGKVYGTFEEKVIFKQPFTESEKIYDKKTSTKNILSIFDFDIPLYISNPKGNFKEDNTEKTLTFFGIKTPISIKKAEITKYEFKDKTISCDEALNDVYNQSEIYEKNYLSDYTIKDKLITEKINENDVELIVIYKLYGEISDEVEFFINK